MAEPILYTSATKMCNPVPSSSSLEQALVYIRLFTEPIVFTRAIKSNKRYLKCHVNQYSTLQEQRSTRVCHTRGRCEEKGMRASPPASRDLATEPTSSKPAHLNLIPREHIDNHLSLPRRRKGGWRGHKALTCFLVPSVFRSRWQHFACTPSQSGQLCN